MSPLDALCRRFWHHAWACAALADAVLATPAPGALRPLAHVLAADRVWHHRLTGAPTHDLEIWPDLDARACRALLQETTADWRSTLDTLDDLGATVSYRTSRGELFVSTVADVLDHVLLHAAHHCGQATAALRAAGVMPPTLDFIFWVRSGEPAP